MKVEFANAKMELVTIDGEVQVLGRNTAVRMLLNPQPSGWVDRLLHVLKNALKVGTKESVV